MEELANKKTGKGFGIAGFIFSIIGIIIAVIFPLFYFSWVVIYFGILGPLIVVIGVIGLILCIAQYKRKRTGIATAGLILNIILIILGILTIIGYFVVKSILENAV